METPRWSRSTRRCAPSSLSSRRSAIRQWTRGISSAHSSVDPRTACEHRDSIGGEIHTLLAIDLADGRQLAYPRQRVDLLDWLVVAPPRNPGEAQRES